MMIYPQIQTTSKTKNCKLFWITIKLNQNITCFGVKTVKDKEDTGRRSTSGADNTKNIENQK